MSEAPGTLADLFVALLRTLEQSPDDTRAAAERHEADPQRAGRHARRLTALLEDGGRAAALDAWVRSSDDASAIERALLAAQAIDAWYAPLAAYHDPCRATTDDHVEARRRHNRDGRLNSRAGDGQLILRPGLLGRAMNLREAARLAPFDVADLFQTLFLVPPAAPAEDPHDNDGQRPISVRYRRVAEVADQAPMDPDWTPIIGVVPLAQTESDLAIHQFSKDGEEWYDPVPRDLSRAATEAIDGLAARGASIILFPEVSVQPATLDAIKAAVRRHAVDGPIRYVLAGLKDSAGDNAKPGEKPHNRAVLIDRTGAEIAVQTKLHCWDLDSNQCQSYDLRDRNGRLLDCAKEFITPGDRLTILELPNMGRLAVMICEDLGRTQPIDLLHRGMMVDWIVTPVMDSGLTRERWQAREGGESSRAGYCRVIVANSMALSHRFNRYCRATGQEDMVIRDCGVALLFQPRANQDSAPRVELLTLDLDRPDPGYVHARWEPSRWPELKDAER